MKLILAKRSISLHLVNGSKKDKGSSTIYNTDVAHNKPTENSSYAGNMINYTQVSGYQNQPGNNDDFLCTLARLQQRFATLSNKTLLIFLEEIVTFDIS